MKKICLCALIAVFVVAPLICIISGCILDKDECDIFDCDDDKEE